MVLYGGPISLQTDRVWDRNSKLKYIQHTKSKCVATWSVTTRVMSNIGQSGGRDYTSTLHLHHLAAVYHLHVRVGMGGRHPAHLYHLLHPDD